MLIKHLTKIGAYTFYVVGQRLGHHVLIQNVCEKIGLFKSRSRIIASKLNQSA